MFRYFRATSDSVYEQARATLDSAWGYPSADGETVTTFTPCDAAIHDAQSRPYLQVRAEFCEYEASSLLLQQAIAGGVIEEITEQQWMSVLPNGP
jgi:hypothetical protein